MIHEDITTTIGNTPIVRINRLGPDHVDLFVKVESFNPGASVKDPLALGINLDAERRGLLKPGDTSSRPPAAIPGWPWPWSAPLVATASSPSWSRPSRSSAAC